MAAVTSSNVSFGLIPPEDWNQPDWIDEEKAKAGREALVEQSIIYGGKSLRLDILYFSAVSNLSTESVSYAMSLSF